MSGRLGTLGDVDTDVGLTAGLVVPGYVPTGLLGGTTVQGLS